FSELSNRGYQHNPHQSGGRCSTGYTFRNGRCERSAHVTQSPTQFPTPQHKEDQNKYYPNWNRNTQYGRVSSKDTHVVVATPFANKNTCKCRQLYHSRNQRKCGKLRNLNDPESLKRQFQGRDRSIEEAVGHSEMPASQFCSRVLVRRLSPFLNGGRETNVNIQGRLEVGVRFGSWSTNYDHRLQQLTWCLGQPTLFYITTERDLKDHKQLDCFI
ncbi:unnamed protein product, partial [Hymenolepis diminuta]